MPFPFQRGRAWLAAVLLVAAVNCPGCTDWDAESGAVRAPGWAPGPGSGDQTTAADGNAYAVWDGGALDGGADAPALDTAADVAVADAGLPDSADLTDSGAQSDADDVDDSAETEPYTFDGKADFVGWPDAPPPEVTQPDAIQTDSAVVDATQSDTIQPDTIVADVAQPDVAQPDAIQTDSAVVDATQPDTIQPDAIGVDVTQPDATQPDAIVVDVTQPDATVVDVAQPDVTQPDAILVDVTQPDSILVDTIVVDAVVPDSSGSDAQISLDTSYTPDWIGYPDTDFGADADIYTGAIGSCLQLYLYQQESCGKEQPTADCINSLLPDASLYAQFLFEPLRACETEVCVPQCAGASDSTCFERCVGKMCAAQFFACTANAASGKSDCASTFACSQAYEGKFLTMSAKCYAAATPTAQAQFVSVISCTIQPQTESCVKELAGCYGAGANGTLSCGQIASCADGCGGDDACVQTCIGNGTPEGIALMDNWWDCLVQVCQPKCNGNEVCTEQCGQSECLSPLIQCLAN